MTLGEPQRQSSPDGASGQTHRARILGWSEEGYPLVRLLGRPSPVLMAQLSTSLSDEDVDRAIAEARDAVVHVFDDAPTPSVCIISIMRGARGTEAREHGKGAPGPAERQVFEASEELVLACGSASISLRADGKIKIRGEDVVTRARRTHWIKGGVVLIN